MDKKIIELINKEDKKNPLTDEEIAEKLNIFRETVTNIRKGNNIKNSRERRKEFLIEDIKNILMKYEDISNRKLTSVLIEKGYDIGKYAVGKLRSEVENLQELQNKNTKVNHEDKGKIQETFKENIIYFLLLLDIKGALKIKLARHKQQLCIHQGGFIH